MTLKTLDDAAGNILRQKFAAGLFEGSWKTDPATVLSKLDSYRPLALEAARQGITLLTNANKTLPFKFARKRIVVVGALADDADSHVGGYTNGGAAVVTTWAAVQKECAASPGCTATKVDGAAPGSFDTSGLQAAADAVALADVVIAVVGDNGQSDISVTPLSDISVTPLSDNSVTPFVPRICSRTLMDCVTISDRSMR